MEENNRLISIIVPIYNVEKYLSKCIESLLNQTYTNIEILLVNDGSTDNSKKICEQFKGKDSRIKLINKENGGLSDARNKGLQKSIGKYITFVDSDDYVEKNYIETLYSLITKFNSEIAIADFRVIKGDKQKIKEKDIKEYCITSEKAIDEMLYSDFYYISACSKLYKKELFENVEFPKGKMFEDVGTTYKLIIKANKIACTNKKIYNYVIRNNSITTSKFKSEHYDLIELTKIMCEDILKKYPNMEKGVLRRKIYASISTLNRMLLSKKTKVDLDLVNYIKKNGKTILKDNKVPKRDKIAIILINLNLDIYKIFLKIYKK